jgi:hypothetical protein
MPGSALVSGQWLSDSATLTPPSLRFYEARCPGVSSFFLERCERVVQHGLTGRIRDLYVEYFEQRVAEG